MFNHYNHNDQLISGIDLQATGEEIPDASQYKNDLYTQMTRVCWFKGRWNKKKSNLFNFEFKVTEEWSILRSYIAR